MRYLDVCGIVRDRAEYLREWVNYHAVLGVEHFFIYDDFNDPPLAESLADYAASGLATIIRPERPMPQLSAYADCLRRATGQTRWVAFIDSDEFLSPRQDDDLRVLLTDYDKHAGLAVSWLMFGSSGQVLRPEGLQIESYVHRLPTQNRFNCSVKSIVQPRLTRKALSPHNFKHVEGHATVNEEEFPVSGPFSYNSVERIQLNHYFFRSQQDFAEKIARGEMWVSLSEKPGSKYDMSHFYWQLDAATDLDETARRFASRTRRAMAEARSGFVASFNQQQRRKTLQDYLQQTLGLLQAQDIDGAETLLGLAATQYADDATLWRLRSHVLAQSGRLDKAMDSLKRSIQIQSSPEAFYELVGLSLRKSDDARALKAAVYLENRMQGDWSYFQAWDDRLDKAKLLGTDHVEQVA